MEKGKTGQRRGAQPKVRALPPPGDFIALGSKSTSSSRQGSDSPLDPKLGSTKPSGGSSSLDRKKDSASGSISIGSKKVKLSAAASTIAPVGRIISERKEVSHAVVTEHWEASAECVEPIELVNSVLKTDDEEKIDSLLCGAVKQLKSSRTKTESSLYLGLIYLAKVRPQYLTSELVIEALCSLLKKTTASTFKSKGSSLVSVLSANILLNVLQDERCWPESLVKAFVDDSLGDRIWVDHVECKAFVDNLLTAFGTVLPSQSQLTSDLGFKPDCPSPTPSVTVEDDESSDSTLFLECREIMDNVPVLNRFTMIKSKVEKIALDVIKEQLTRRQQPMDVSRNMLRFLASTCGLSDVRLLAAQRLEMWLQHTKLTRPSQDLLMSVCLNCRLHNQNDVEVISSLTRIRLKAKPLVNHYLQCIRELLDKHPENLSTVLKHTIYNELSNSRNPNNMAVLSVIFQHSPGTAAKMLAEVFQDLLANRDDYLRALRALLREIVRSLRHDMQFSVFCLGLMTERKDQVFKELEQPIKERMFLSLGDLITMTIFLAISPAVKEAAALYVRGDRKDIAVLKAYQNQVAIIQRDAVWWLHTIVMNSFKVGRNEFIHCLHKILFMEQAEHYFNKDNWPSESDRPLMIRLASEMPVLEDTLMRVLIIGLSKDHPLNSQDALELADQLVRRAASLHCEGYPVLQVQRLELIELLFNLCVYHHPESIVLPKGYQPPSLAISKLYWKVWIILLITVAHNPGTFGVAVWKPYATIRTLIEMCITGHFSFPPPTLASGEKADEIKSKELQLAQLEKQEILQFESHLAAASTNVVINEENSLLLAQLTTLDPQGIARHPPVQVLEQLKALNNSLKLGHLLCRSRNPDFLLDIIQRQGTSESMPWLAELVASSAGSFDMLPIQCLCEFLLHEPVSFNLSDADDKDENKADKVERAKLKQKQKKQKQLLQYMKTLLFDATSDPLASCEILDYFLRRLSSKQSSSRNLAAQGLQMVLGRSDTEDEAEKESNSDRNDKNNLYGWVSQMTLLPHFKVIKRQAGINLRQACSVENNPVAVSAYIKFLACYHPADTLQDLSDLALDIAHVLVNRTTLVNSLIPNNSVPESDFSVQNAFLRIFFSYLPRALKLAKETYSWSISQDQILVQWPSGYAATMHILIAHAMVVLLTYGPPADNSKYYETLLEHWFPSEGEPPQAFLVDTSELALLFPDWLKLRMISSKVDRLVDAALKDLDPSQLVLFVQSFGIPVQTVTKLLHSLDAGAQVEPESLKQAVVDKSYMCQLVDVQQQRGAIGGNKFVEILHEFREPDLGDEKMCVETTDNHAKAIFKPAQPDVESNIADNIFHVFCPSSTNPKMQRIVFQAFMKKLGNQAVSKHSTSSTFLADIQKTLTEILFSSSCQMLVKGLHQYSSFSCAIFSLLFQCQNDQARLMFYLPLVELIMNQSMATKSPLMSLLQKHSLKLQGVKIKADETEEVKLRIMKDEWNSQNTADLVLKLKEAITISSSSSHKKQQRKLGMYADWMKLIEPEILKTCVSLEANLLFSEHDKEKSEGSSELSCRQYLLALLIHHTNWSTIHRAINLCLDSTASEKLEPSAVLDFLWACVDIPRLWQGQDKNKSKHSNPSRVLVINENQICHVINYIIRDASNSSCDDQALDSMKNVQQLSSRLPLLLHFLNNSQNLVDAAVNHLLVLISQHSTREPTIERQFLVSLYAQVPHLIFKTSKENFRLSMLDNAITSNGTSSMDVFSHNLLSALSSIKHGKQGMQKLHDLEIECRKMAVTHPLLLIRQLPMISASLNGRLSFGFNVFCLRNHLAYFNCIMGLLELMKPYVFHERHFDALCKIISLYFDFVQIHGMKNKQGVPLTQKFIKFLSSFMVTNSTLASQVISKHFHVLESLAERYPDLPYLKQLLLNKTLMPKEVGDEPTMNRKASTAAKSERDSRVIIKSTSDYFVPYNRAQISTFITQLSSKNTDDILSALHDLGNIAQRNPSILEQTFDCLKKLMLINHGRCREVTYDLIMIHLKNIPSSSGDFLPVYNSCLSSENSDILITALEHLAEVIIISQECAGDLLDKVFKLGITTGIDVKPYVSETLFLLSMQDGL